MHGELRGKGWSYEGRVGARREGWEPRGNGIKTSLKDETRSSGHCCHPWSNVNRHPRGREMS